MALAGSPLTLVTAHSHPSMRAMSMWSGQSLSGRIPETTRPATLLFPKMVQST